MIRFYYLSVLFLIFLFHLSFIGNGFVWLDHGDIEHGRAIIPVDAISHAFFTRFGETGFYRPLVTIMHNIDAALYGKWAPGFHLTNVLLHLAVVVVIPLFLSVFFRLSVADKILVMLLVGMHPLGWLPVGAISYRSELLLALFLFLTVYLHAKARTTTNGLYGFLVIIILLLALFSKETALVLVPLLILLWEITYKNRQKANSKGQAYILYISEFAVLAMYIFLRTSAVPEIWRTVAIPLPLSEAIGTRIFVWMQLFLDFISPFKPSLSDAVPIMSVWHPIVLVFLLLFALGGFIITKTGLRSSWSKALLLFALLLTPALNIIPVPRLGSPHYGYIALAGFAAIVLLIWHVPRTSVIRFLIVAWLVLMTVTTFQSGFQFANDRTLFTPEVQRDSHFLEGYFYLGNAYLYLGDLKKAEEAYKHALQKNQRIIAYQETQATYANYVLVEVKQKKFQEADALLSKAQQSASINEKAAFLYKRALIANQNKDYVKVMKLLHDKKALDGNLQAYVLLADALHHSGKNEEARKILEEALPLADAAQKVNVQALLNSLQPQKK